MASAMRGIVSGRIRSCPAGTQTSILNRLSVRLLSSIVNFNPTEDEIISSASSIVKQCDDIIKRDPNNDKFDLIKMIKRDGTCKTYPLVAKLRVMSLALDVLQNYPKVDLEEIFIDRLYIRSLMSNDSKDDITKDEVASRVLDVVKCYPKVDHSKVTEESHFRNDLGLDKKERGLLTCGIEEEFKLPDSSEVKLFNSCKHATDYIYPKCIEMCESYADDIISNTFYAIEKVDDLIKCGNTGSGIAEEAFDIIKKRLKDYPEYVYLKVLSKVIDAIQNYPQVDGEELFSYRMIIRMHRSSDEDHKADITKEEVTSRVLQVIKCYPKVDHSKVSEESHFHDDLGLDEDESDLMLDMLGIEFSLPNIPEEDKTFYSCRVVIDYIYDHQRERVSHNEFRSICGVLDLDTDSDSDIYQD